MKNRKEFKYLSKMYPHIEFWDELLLQYFEELFYLPPDITSNSKNK